MGRHGGCIKEFPPGRPHTIVEGDPFALHDWRLVSREWFDASYMTVVKGQPGIKNPDAFGWRETWYCTRCRKVDERLAQTSSKEE